MKHSEGPWKRDGEKQNTSRSAIIRDAAGFEVANTNSFLVETYEANANLVAAAPELLKACIAMRRTMQSPDSEESKLADTAIEKATGKPAERHPQ